MLSFDAVLLRVIHQWWHRKMDLGGWEGRTHTHTPFAVPQSGLAANAGKDAEGYQTGHKTALGIHRGFPCCHLICPSSKQGKGSNNRTFYISDLF